MDEGDFAVEGKVGVDVSYLKCIEKGNCFWIKVNDTTYGSKITLDPGESQAFDNVLPGFIPTERGMYKIRTRFFDEDGDVSYDFDGNPVEDTTYFIVRQGSKLVE